MGIFDEIDAQMNSAQMQQAIAAAQQGQKTFEETPAGRYLVKLRTMELGTSKTKGKPMLITSLRVVDGQYKNRILWYNIPICGTKNDPYMIVKCLNFLTSLRAYDANGYVKIDFQSYGMLMSLVAYVKQCVDICDLSYTIQYEPDEFDRVTVLDVHYPPQQ